MPYGIMWLLMPRRGLTQSVTINRDFHAQITKGKRGEINNIHNVVNNKMMKFNHGGCSWVQCLASLHGC